jgi:hypothetical protein
VTEFLTAMLSVIFVTRKSDNARIWDAFKVLAYQNKDRKGTKSSKLSNQATADHYVTWLKSFKNVRPSGDRNVLMNNVHQRYYLGSTVQLYMLHCKQDKGQPMKMFLALLMKLKCLYHTPKMYIKCAIIWRRIISGLHRRLLKGTMTCVQHALSY